MCKEQQLYIFTKGSAIIWDALNINKQSDDLQIIKYQYVRMESEICVFKIYENSFQKNICYINVVL